MAVRVDRYADPAAFWRDTQAFLEQNEAGNTQVLAIASRHAVEPSDTPPCGFTVTTMLVAELSRHLLAQGRFPLYLFADTENPVANGVYRRVGFRPAGEHVHLTRVDPVS